MTSTYCIPDLSHNKRDFGFVIISTDNRISESIVTIDSIVGYYNNIQIQLIVNYDLDQKEIDTLNKKNIQYKIYNKNLCSMINFGVESSKNDWNFLIPSGKRITTNLIEKILYFCRGNKDLLYSCTKKKYNFTDSFFDCWFFNRKFSGPLIDFDDDFQLSKLVWAIENELEIKSVIGGTFN